MRDCGGDAIEIGKTVIESTGGSGKLTRIVAFDGGVFEGLGGFGVVDEGIEIKAIPRTALVNSSFNNFNFTKISRNALMLTDIMSSSALVNT